jgi:hypothetical protein
MTYIDIYLDTEPSYEIIDNEKAYDPVKYYAVVEVPNKDAKGSHWHVLLRQEQYDKRQIDAKPCITLTLADDKYKKTKLETGKDYDEPIHTFGGHTHDPEIIAAKIAAAELLELEK